MMSFTKNISGHLLCLLLLCSATPVVSFAAQTPGEPKKPDFRKISPTQASIQIDLEADSSPDAASYIQGQELGAFVEFLLSDETSPVAILKKQLAAELCKENGSQQQAQPTCGRVHFSQNILVKFIRTGWMNGDAQWLVVVGFVRIGSGHEMTSHYALLISEAAETQLDNSTQEKIVKTSVGKVTKVFSFLKALPYWSE